MLKKFFIFLFLYIIPLSCTAIEDVKKVNLQEAINVTLTNNIDLKVNKLNEDIAKNNIKSANRLQNPSFNSFYNLGAAGWNEPQQLGFGEVIEIGKRSARKNLAKSNLKLAIKNVEYQKFNIAMDVREAYINLVAAKSVLYTLEQQMTLQEELLDIAKRHVKSGSVPEIDAIQANISLNQMITQVNTAKVNVKSAQIEFNKIINASDNVFYDTVDKIFSEENNFEEMLTPHPYTQFPDYEKIEERALKYRYDIQIAKQEVDVAGKNLVVVARQRIPDIELIGGYMYQRGSHTDDGRYNNGAYAGANIVNIPLFYNYGPEIKNAAIALKQAELNCESVQNKAKKDLSGAYFKFLNAATNLNYYESKILICSEELIDASKKSYENGKSDITSLIVMKQSYKSIIVGYTYALAEYYNSWTDFLREVNTDSFDLFTMDL